MLCIVLLFVIILGIICILFIPNRDYFINIAHAGGRLNGKTYLNSIEAIEHNRQKGFQYFEIDIYNDRGTIYVAHDPKRIKKGCPKIQDIDRYSIGKNIYFILDIKNKYPETIQKISSLVQNHDQYIPQIYSLEDLKTIIELKTFKKVLLANWKYTPSFETVLEIINLAKKNNIEIIGTSLWSKYTDKYDAPRYNFYKKHKIPIFFHGGMKTQNQLLWAKAHIDGIFNLTRWYI